MGFLFSLVHLLIGLAHEETEATFIRFFRVGVTDRDADLLALECQQEMVDARADFVFLAGTQNRDELVAADAVAVVFVCVAETFADAGGGRLNELVAGQMPFGVVGAFEEIHVKQADGR